MTEAEERAEDSLHVDIEIEISMEGPSPSMRRPASGIHVRQHLPRSFA